VITKELKSYTINNTLRGLTKYSEGHGAFSFIIKAENIKQFDLNFDYGRTNLALKVFRIPFVSLDTFVWGNMDHSPLLWDSTIIQNLYADENLAPRIYDIVQLNLDEGVYIAQVTDFLEGEFIHPSEAPAFWGEVNKVRDHYNLVRCSDWNEKNLIENKWVDFQCFLFRDKDAYLESIKQRLNIYNPCSRNSQPYVDIAELGVKGMRDWEHRVKAFQFNEIDFKGKTVLDWGSNTGAFCREASRRGAKRVIGMEGNGNTVRIQRELSNYLGFFNIDFYTINLRTKEGNRDVLGDIKQITNMDNFDIHFFFSMDQHVGFPKGVGGICNELMIVEGGVAQQIEYFEDLMKPEFKKVEFAGFSTDHARRTIMRGWNADSNVS
jgi:hypothetical protein